jgi:hypothetical protein
MRQLLRATSAMPHLSICRSRFDDTRELCLHHVRNKTESLSLSKAPNALLDALRLSCKGFGFEEVGQVYP